MTTEQTPQELVKLLTGPRLRCRTGILLLSRKMLGKEPDLAARLGVDAVDYRECLRSGLPTGTNYVNIDDHTEFKRVDALASAASGSPCILVYNADIAISKLEHSARELFWDALLQRMIKRRHAVVFAMPEMAGHLLPRLDVWEQSERVAIYSGNDDNDKQETSL